ncbi:MAG: hypothetical protein NPIRA06_23600 [Nitrospirales bacterium]|nr:MAG: hypothetical protein NPIRA06_23600 [Nitrospirales bacterium]
MIGGTFATFGNRHLYLEERLSPFKCINTQNRNMGQVETGLTFQVWIMTSHLPVRAIICFAEPGTKKETETY